MSLVSGYLLLTYLLWLLTGYFFTGYYSQATYFGDIIFIYGGISLFAPWAFSIQSTYKATMTFEIVYTGYLHPGKMNLFPTQSRYHDTELTGPDHVQLPG